MELSNNVRNKFYSTENTNLLKGVINQFLKDKHNTRLDENKYSGDLLNVMTDAFNKSLSTNLYNRYNDSVIITKEINRLVISKIVPIIQNKLFKKVSIPPRPGSTKDEMSENYSNSQFSNGFVKPIDDNLNMKALPNFNSVDFPKSTDKSSFENVSDLYEKAISSRNSDSNFRKVDTPIFAEKTEQNSNEMINEKFENIMSERGIPGIIPSKTSSIPNNSSVYNPELFNKNVSSSPKNTLPCPEGDVKPSVPNPNLNVYNKQQTQQIDDNLSFDELNKKMENNVEQYLVERTANLTSIKNEGFEDGIISSAIKGDETSNIVSLTAPTKNQVSVLGVDSSLEKGNYIPPDKTDENTVETKVVKDESGIEPIDSYEKSNVPDYGFSIDEKEKMQKKINELEELYKQKLIVPKALTNQDDLVEAATYITIDSSDRNRTVYPNPHSYTILLDSQNNSHNIGVLKNIVSAKLIGITIPKSKDIEKLRYLYLNVDQFGGPYTGSNKAASDAFARLKFERTFRHRIMGTGAFVSPDLDDVVSSFPGAKLNNIDRLTISFSKPNGDSFSFGNDLATASSGAGSQAGQDDGTNFNGAGKISTSGDGRFVVLTLADATGLSEGDAITISGATEDTATKVDISAVNDLNGDHIIKEILGNNKIMLETGWTGATDATGVSVASSVVKSYDADNVCDSMQHSMTFRVTAMVRRNKMNNSDDGTYLVEGDQMVVASMGSGGVGSLMGIRKCTGSNSGSV